jgi:hypothetical protein
MTPKTGGDMKSGEAKPEKKDTKTPPVADEKGKTGEKDKDKDKSNK